MRLTAAQQRFYDIFGYLVLRGALREEMPWIEAEFERLVADPALKAVPFADRSARLSTLLDHPRIQGAVEGLLGPDAAYMSSDGGVKSADTIWHSDGHWRDHHALQKCKILIYLDALDATNGCLRVIPGSHRVGEGFAEALEPLAWEGMRGGTPLDLPPAAWPNVALETQPGDIIIFNQHLKHAAFHSGKRRRLFTLLFVEQARTPEQVEQLRAYMRFHLSAWMQEPYGELMVSTAGADRMRHLRQGLEHRTALREAATDGGAGRTPVQQGG